MDYDLPSVFEESFVIARKQHRCCECRRPIEKGADYHHAKGCWDGKWSEYKTCMLCNQLRNELECETAFPPFEHLEEWAQEAGVVFPPIPY